MQFEENRLKEFIREVVQRCARITQRRDRQQTGSDHAFGSGELKILVKLVTKVYTSTYMYLY